MAHFSFSEEDHAYALAPAADKSRGWRRVPSVTQVLETAGMSPDFSFLDGYYLDRGRAVHRAMALELLGQLDWSTLDERVEPFIRHGREWLELIGATPLVVELRWVHRALEYGGTLDLFCESSLGPLLIDWKTVTYDAAYDIQVAGGYLPMLIDAAEDGAVGVAPGDVRRARVGVVTLGHDAPKAHWIERDNQAEIFQAALAVANWRSQHKR